MGRFYKILLVVLLLIVIVSCSTGATLTSPVESTPTPTEVGVVGKFQIPNRYIDWQAFVVCYYLEDAIDCMPLVDTKLLGGQ